VGATNRVPQVMGLGSYRCAFARFTIQDTQNSETSALVNASRLKAKTTYYSLAVWGKCGVWEGTLHGVIWCMEGATSVFIPLQP